MEQGETLTDCRSYGPGMHTITLKHNFEAAHRLPHLGGKCANLHGHSWWVEVAVSAPVWSADYTVVEFGGFKAMMRDWIDTHLDHGAMLGVDDPLGEVLQAEKSKLYVFGVDTQIAAWPTVEAVAALLAEKAAVWLTSAPGTPRGARISRVVVRETHVNAAEFEPPLLSRASAVEQMWTPEKTATYEWKTA